MNLKKIIDINNISSLLKKKRYGKSVVHCHGVFDFFHFGHLKYLKSAKKFGQILVVSVTSDNFVNKGSNRPFYKAQQRLEMLSSIDIVDYVVLSNHHNAEKIIEKIRPDFYVKGPDYNNAKDYTGNIIKEARLVKKFGGKIVYTKDEMLSSSSIINENFNSLNDEQKAYQIIIKKKYTFKNIEKLINNISRINVSTVGETILDEYVFCESIGKSGKEPHLVIRDIKTETYVGGVIAIAKHIESFTKKINIISVLSEKPKDATFIKKHISKATKFNYIKKIHSPTIKKKRFIDHLTNHKLLGVYSINDRELTKIEMIKLNNILKKNLKKKSVIIISDYGHGFLPNSIAKMICNKYKNIFLNAQLNAANIGYHTLKNYNNFNTLIINESELRHEFKDRHSDVEILIKKLSSTIKLKNIVVTRGANGAICYSKKNKKFYYCPAFANKITDKVGAGDALLAIFSICLYSKINIELSLFIGCLAAASVVETMGNSYTINKITLLKNIESFLK
jgi:rfaE bifunctional protein kinase chain/domain/rfaE bifunctional protein nucleotidyltransferase chain/domain